MHISTFYFVLMVIIHFFNITVPILQESVFLFSFLYVHSKLINIMFCKERWGVVNPLPLINQMMYWIDLYHRFTPIPTPCSQTRLMIITSVEKLSHNQQFRNSIPEFVFNIFFSKCMNCLDKKKMMMYLCNVLRIFCSKCIDLVPNLTHFKKQISKCVIISKCVAARPLSKYC